MPITPLPFTLAVDRVITVKGTTNADCERFSINLCCGSDCSEDTALHFNPRFDQEQVVRNASVGGWGQEETEGEFPFTKDSPYDVKITVREGHYEISVNDSHFCNFNHRMPIEVVRNVYVEGDVTANIDIGQSVYPVPFPVSDGAEIIVNGVAPSTAERFSINLCSGTDVSTGTALHFNPRFDGNEVVRNHFDDGWGQEETEGELPFTQGAPYEVKIAVKDAYFQVFVNGSHFCHFNHRLDKDAVKNVCILDSDVTNVQFVDKSPINYPSIPVSTPIKGGMAPGVKIVISGKPTSNPERFSVNLVCGPDVDNCDLALHFDIRLNYGETPNYSVRTHRSGGDYGEEDREESSFPFAPDTPFTIAITAQHDCYTIYVDDQHHSTFNHRIQPLQNVDYLEVHGDVEISQIRFD